MRLIDNGMNMDTGIATLLRHGVPFTEEAKKVQEKITDQKLK